MSVRYDWHSQKPSQQCRRDRKGGRRECIMRKERALHRVMEKQGRPGIAPHHNMKAWKPLPTFTSLFSSFLLRTSSHFFIFWPKHIQHENSLDHQNTTTRYVRRGRQSINCERYIWSAHKFSLQSGSSSLHIPIGSTSTGIDLQPIVLLLNTNQHQYWQGQLCTVLYVTLHCSFVCRSICSLGTASEARHQMPFSSPARICPNLKQGWEKKGLASSC